jgi:hypothetical protein
MMLAASALLALVVPGCADSTTVTVPKSGTITPPTFAAIPEDLADSAQLDAIERRDTAGLAPTAASADAALLAEALDALVAQKNPAELSRVSIYADSVYFTFADEGVRNRKVSFIYDDPDNIYESEPGFDDTETYPIGAVDPVAVVRLFTAIESRFPDMRVTAMDLDVSGSYGFGLAWNIDVSDARGQLATVYADVDGAIVGVDAGF